MYKNKKNGPTKNGPTMGQLIGTIRNLRKELDGRGYKGYKGYVRVLWGVFD